LTEHELDHVLLGYFNDEPVLNTEEVEAWKWASLETIEKDMEDRPETYTAWFKIVFPQFKKYIEENQ
jgi:isopentenyl-diphosphate delta-isomerase